MSSFFHTPISTGADADAAIVNAPLAQLDAAIAAISGGGGSSPFVLIAAHDATPIELAAAAYACDGTADDVQLAAAIAALGNGTIFLSSGHFTIAETVTLSAGIVLRGASRDATVVSGVSGMTASMLVLNSDTTLADLKITAPSSMTSDAVATTVEAQFVTVRDVTFTGGGNSAIYMLAIGSCYDVRLDNLYVSTGSNGVKLDNPNHLYNTGNTSADQVEIHLTAASRVAFLMSGYTGGTAKSTNLCRISHLGVTASSPTGCTGLRIVNSSWCSWDTLTLESCAVSLDMAGAVGSGTATLGHVFTNVYADGPVNQDANTGYCLFLGGKLIGTITQGQTEVSRQNIYLGTVNGSTLPLAVRAPTNPCVFVVSHNGTAAEKAVADYLCDNTADDVDIAAAIATLTNGGTVLLSSGTFTTSSTLTLPAGTTIRGAGRAATVLAGATGMTASMLSLATNCTLTGLEVAVPAAMTSDPIVTAYEAQFVTVRDCYITGGGDAGIYLLAILSAYDVRLDNVQISTASNGLKFDNPNHVYVTGNSQIDQVEVRLTTAGRVGVLVSGYSGSGSPKRALSWVRGSRVGVSIGSGAGTGSTAMRLINATNTSWESVSLSGCDTSLDIQGAVNSGPPSSNNLFTNLYADNAITEDANTVNCTFVSGKLTGTITQAQTTSIWKNRYYGTADASNTMLDTSSGAPGADGKTVRNGSGAPSSGLGVDGDFYIDTTAHAIYGPKATTWGSATSLVGPTGSAGSTGATGATGATGPAGTAPPASFDYWRRGAPL